MNTHVDFQTAKLLKEKGFHLETLHFYTKPNSKMFGIDEHGRSYFIKNLTGKLYTRGEYATLNAKNVYSAPTIAEVCTWLYEKHGIWISVHPVFEYNDGRIDYLELQGFQYWITVITENKHDTEKSHADTNPCPKSATEAGLNAINYCLTNFI